MPAKDRVRCDNAGKLPQKLPAQQLALHCQTASLRVGDAKPLLPDDLPVDLVLRQEVIDDQEVVPVDAGHDAIPSVSVTGEG